MPVGSCCFKPAYLRHTGVQESKIVFVILLSERDGLLTNCYNIKAISKELTARLQ
jgi:hypothetical protein